jgi:2-dehydro-3-deoxygluconokinase
MKSLTTLDVVAIGEPMVEFNEQPGGLYRAGIGGDTSNAMIAAARLGARAGYVTLLGEDRFADAICAAWDREGVDRSFVGRHPSAATGVYVVNHDATGHHFSYLRAGSAASLIAPRDVPAEAVTRARFLHVSAVSQAISANAEATVAQAIAIAQTAGVRVSYDTNLRLRLWPLERARAVIAATVPHAAVLKTSLDDARTLEGLDDAEAIARHYQQAGAGIVVVTLGGDGALVATGDAVRRIDPMPVDAVDATGAGDAFAGALLAELCRGVDPIDAARFANAAAALSTRGYGAIEPLPRRDEVEAFMRQGPQPPRS